MDTGEVTPVIAPGLGLDRDRHAGGSDRHRVDISAALPGQRVPKPPALRLEGGERALDLVLRASADPTATSKRKPVASPEAQPDGRQKQQRGERRRSRPRGREPEQRGDGASQRGDGASQRGLSGGRSRRYCGDARSSRCDRLELEASAEHALALS
jgi:hypothetical protein